MTKFKKIGEIYGYDDHNIKDEIEHLEKQGIIVVDDDKSNAGWKTYHILKVV